MPIQPANPAVKLQPIDGSKVAAEIRAQIAKERVGGVVKATQDAYKPASRPVQQQVRRAEPKRPLMDGEKKIGLTMGGFVGGLTGFLVAASKEALAGGFGLQSAAGLGAGILGGVGFAAALIFGLPAAIKGVKKLLAK